jgi:hypothetical protein
MLKNFRLRLAASGALVVALGAIVVQGGGGVLAQEPTATSAPATATPVATNTAVPTNPPAPTATAPAATATVTAAAVSIVPTVSVSSSGCGSALISATVLSGGVAVPNGTQVNFATNFGVIQSTALTTGGAASVLLTVPSGSVAPPIFVTMSSLGASNSVGVALTACAAGGADQQATASAPQNQSTTNQAPLPVPAQQQSQTGQNTETQPRSQTGATGIAPPNTGDGGLR